MSIFWKFIMGLLLLVLLLLILSLYLGYLIRKRKGQKEVTIHNIRYPQLKRVDRKYMYDGLGDDLDC